MVTLSLCAFVELYLLFQGGDTRLNETLANGAFFLAGSVIGAYVFGATWDDIHNNEVRKHDSFEHEKID